MHSMEKRVHLRKELQTEGWIADPWEDTWEHIKLLDISKRGVAFISQEKMAAGTLRPFRFHLPGSSRPIHFIGKITYCMEHPYLAGYRRTGVQFDDMDIVDLAAIEWFVDHHALEPS